MAELQNLNLSPKSNYCFTFPFADDITGPSSKIFISLLMSFSLFHNDISQDLERMGFFPIVSLIHLESRSHIKN